MAANGQRYQKLQPISDCYFIEIGDLWHNANMRNERRTSSANPIVPSEGLCIYLLGTLRIERDGVAIHLPRRKVEALLAYLLLHPEQQTRDHLATLFWGDSADAQARHSLRTALATLRKEVADDLLLTDRNHVQRNPAFACWVDLHTLLAMEQELDQMPIDLLLATLTLWQGDLLTGFYDDWILLDQEHYRERLLKLSLQATQALRARSEYPQAITVAQRLLTLDPANEHAHQHLMFCYMASGDRPAALRQYELCERMLAEELDVPPQPETTALYHWIRQQRGEEASTAARITNLPIPLTSFVGRTEATAAIKRLLNPTRGKTRLLTLTGAGGSGKTRLAIQAAADLIDRFADGVWWVELAALTEDEQVARVVAKALGVTERPNEPALQSVVNFLDEKALLLVIDNCEHLVDASAQLVTELLQHCPYLQILTTSREALSVGGEVIWQVPTLDLPAPQQVVLTDLLLHFECIRLFVERANAVQPGFHLTLANAPAVVNICTQLDGIPLAIELAAARVKVLSVDQIATRLTSAIGARFTLLTQGSRTILPRQQTLRAAIDWSYDLLDAAERQLFQIVSVFCGGFTLAALEQVVAADSALPTTHRPLATIDLLTQLVDKSLVIVEPQEGGHRYRLLETLREYALEQFPNVAERQAVQRHHALFFLGWAEQAAPHLLAAQQQMWLNHFEVEHANLRAALDCLLTQAEYERALHLVVAATRFWGARGYISEGRTWFQKVLTSHAGVSSASVAKALNAAGFLAFRQSDFAEALTLFTQGLALFQEIEDEQGIAEVLQNLALVEIPQGHFALAQQHLEQSLALCRQLQDEYGIARALQHLGHLAYDQDKLTAARAYFEESLACNRALGDQVRIANLLLNLGNTVKLLGDTTSAQHYLQECLTIGRAIDHQGIIGTVLRGLGLHALEQKAYTQARLYGEEALQMTRAVGDKSSMGFALLLLGKVAHKLGENQPALAYYCQNLQIMVELNYRWPIYDVLEQMATLLLDTRQQLPTAARFLGAACAIRQELDHPVTPTDQADYEKHLTLLHQQLGVTLTDQLQVEGQTRPLSQIIAEAQALSLF